MGYKTKVEKKEESQALPAHLAPLLEYRIAQSLDFLDVADIRRDDQDVLVADDLSDLFSDCFELSFNDIGQDDSQAIASHSRRDLLVNAGDSFFYVRYVNAHLANSRAAALPIPLAAPVMTATRPAWMTGCTSAGFIAESGRNRAYGGLSGDG